MQSDKIIDEIKDRFSIFENSMDKYAYLIELGKKTNGIPDRDKNDSNRIYGCASDSWLVMDRSRDGIYTINTDSEAFIVKGLLAILEMIVNGNTNDEIKGALNSSILTSVGLSETISSQRTNGFMHAIDMVNSRIMND